MILVFDTSILIDLERKKENVFERLKKLTETYPAPARITFINQFEFLLGIRERDVKNKEKSISFLNKFSILNTSKITANLLSDLRSKYDKKGIVFLLADLLIASLVIENNMILLTKDKDFEKIEELNTIVI